MYLTKKQNSYLIKNFKWFDFMGNGAIAKFTLNEPQLY